jgi:periplasmic protein TonB
MMTHRILTQWLVAGACLLALPRSSSAQTIGGEVVEAMTAQPLRAYQVRLYYLAQGDSTRPCDSTTTDERGLFQFGGQGTGSYRLEFGPAESRLASSARVEAGTPDTAIAVRFRVPVLELSGAQAFSAKEVQQAAVQASDHAIRYPDELRNMSMTGEVLVRFIVEPTGKVRPGSITVVRSSHPLFTKAVTDGLPLLRFYPARVGGIPVAQLVEEPFTFSLMRGGVVLQ